VLSGAIGAHGTTVLSVREGRGYDPAHVANEGCLVAFVTADRADAVLDAMRARPEGRAAVRIC
jgi:hydrogenase maturation factor